MRRARRVALAFALALVALAGAGSGIARAEVAVRSTVTATRVPFGESFDWVVSVDGAMGAEEPVIPRVDWARVEFRGSSQEMSFVNGQMSARTVFQLHVTPTREGRFQVPTVTVRAKGGVYTTDPIEIEVTPPQPGSYPSLGAGVRPRLKLVASAAPRVVGVGEPVVYTIRFYQGTRLLGEPQYRGPDTPRFYVEPTGTGRTYYEGSGPDRWLVGERRTVLYPTVSGRLTIGRATMACLVADMNSPDGIEVDLTSDPVPIDVRPLPPAPAGFSGAVADAHLTGAIDRARIRADEAVQLTFRLTGTGNLRLAAPPTFDRLADFEIFDRRVDDSLAVEDGIPAGTKVIRYTLLPRRPGVLELPPLRYVVYVPGQGYRTLEWDGARIQVEPGLARGGAAAAAATRFKLVPTEFPGGAPWTPSRPWVGAALVAFGLAAALSRRRRGATTEEARASAERAARLDAALAGLNDARNKGDVPEFWRRAEAALALIGAPGAEELSRRIAQARYAPGGGSPRDMDEVYGRINDLLRQERAHARDASHVPTSAARRFTVLGLVLAGFVLAGYGAYVAFTAPRDAELAGRLRQAAVMLRGDAKGPAQSALLELWNAGARRPGVAIDLAIAAYYDRRLGEAALWTERARRLDPRHPLVLEMIRALTREGAWEGLPVGARAQTTGGELAFAACVAAALGLLLFGLRPRAVRAVALTALAVAVLFAIVAGQSGAAGEAPRRGVILVDTPLADRPGGPSTVELEAGRAVWLEGEAGGWMRVRAGGQVRGFVPQGSVQEI